MKKICVVTLYGNYNFGNKLQLYAVQSICRNIGFDVEALRFFDSNNYNYANNKVKKNILKWREVFKTIVLKKEYRNKKFREFEKNYLIMSRRYVFEDKQHRGIEKKYDRFIVGSDQVWNPYFGLKGDLKFLTFVNKKRKVSLAASIGTEEIPEKMKNDYITGLKSLDYISVREDKAKKLVEELTDRKDVEVILDPTMLIQKEEWKKISKKPENLKDENYILNYFLGNLSDERKEKIKKLASDNGWKIIDVMNPNDKFYNIGPSEFIYLEEHAKLICTDSFHSCVFGILMNTPFVVFDREDVSTKSMNSRIQTLLEKFELLNRKYKGELNNEILQMSFSNINSVLEKERIKAKKFLEIALKG